MSRLPIDDVLPEIAAALRSAPNLVIVAPPGAGKTTRVPPAVIDAGLAGGREVVVLEPRRLAARLAAQRVAGERGQAVGGEVGYQVRFDRAVSEATKIRFVTEGVLTRQLVDDPQLRRVGMIIADEVHERHLQGDLALALARRLQAGPRPDLHIVAMSATLDAEPLARFLGSAIVRSEGRMHPVAIEHLDQPDDWYLDKKVSAAVRQLVADGLDGDILVFLPGAAEIRRAAEACADIAARADLLVVPLHGDLPAADQDRAVARADRRKLILSTNVAESSVTIDGVVAVIDSGLARIPRHSPWSGIPSLRADPVSRASCAQRAGRAGRTRPGRCLRLFTRHDHDGRREHEAPEILRLDLAEVALELHAAGLARLDALTWPDPPPPAAAAAEDLLARLGAVDASGALTDVGRRMLRFPLHPRQARLLCEAEARGVGAEGTILAAVAGERELRLERRGPRAQAKISGPSDLLEDLDAFDEAARDRLTAASIRAAGLDPGAAFAVDRARRQLERMIDDRRSARPRSGTDQDRALQLSILAAYPDRVARRRRAGAPELTFAAGGGATLAPTSVVNEAELVVVTDAEERTAAASRQVIARSATAIEPEWLLELQPDRIRDEDTVVWNPALHRVEAVSRLTFDNITLEETRSPEKARTHPDTPALLADQARQAGLSTFVDLDALDSWRRRVRFAATHAPDLGFSPPDDAWIAAAIARAAEGAASFADLRKLPLLDLVRSSLPPDAARALDRLAPEAIALPGRKRVPIHYEDDRPPWIASRMQDFFTLRDTPKIANNRVPLVLHLLAPNQRPVQVTSDLAGFWKNHYPDLRKQLMRRYPRHPWPETP